MRICLSGEEASGKEICRALNFSSSVMSFVVDALEEEFLAELAFALPQPI
jgi:DNA-binding transcriptional regulator GbsR (MarR family)